MPFQDLTADVILEIIDNAFFIFYFIFVLKIFNIYLFGRLNGYASVLKTKSSKLIKSGSLNTK